MGNLCARKQTPNLATPCMVPCMPLMHTAPETSTWSPRWVDWLHVAVACVRVCVGLSRTRDSEARGPGGGVDSQLDSEKFIEVRTEEALKLHFRLYYN
jgi:hypothetical protein